MDAYDDMLRHTSTKLAPWYVIPADHKWYMRMLVNDIIVSKLEELALHYPKVDDKRRAELQQVKKHLEENG
jgi:hypothetical protein